MYRLPADQNTIENSSQAGQTTTQWWRFASQGFLATRAALPVLEASHSSQPKTIAYHQAQPEMMWKWDIFAWDMTDESSVMVQPWNNAKIRTQIKHCLAASDRHRHQRLTGNSFATLSLSNGRVAWRQAYAYRDSPGQDSSIYNKYLLAFTSN